MQRLLLDFGVITMLKDRTVQHPISTQHLACYLMSKLRINRLVECIPLTENNSCGLCQAKVPTPNFGFALSKAGFTSSMATGGERTSS